MQTKVYYSIKHLRQGASLNRWSIFRQLHLLMLVLNCLLITSSVSAQSFTPRGAAIAGVSNEGVGLALSMSADGNTMAIGNNDDDVSANDPRSSVKVKTWNGTAWVQKGSTLYAEQNGDNFGAAVSLNANGTVLAIGARTYSDIALYGEFSNSGRTYVYTWNGTDWVLRGSALIAGAAEENFGHDVSLSQDGNVLAVGAPGASAGGSLRGLARVYEWTGTSWVKIGSDINGTSNFENFGTSVSLKVTATESVLAVGASGFTPSSGNDFVGRVKIYRLSEGSWGGTWSSPEILNGSNKGDFFGYAVSLSNNGNRLAVGAPTDGLFSAQLIGYARIFDYATGAFAQSGADIVSNFEYDTFGERLALSGDGQYVIIGAKGGVGNENGRAEVYTFTANNWQQVGSDLIGEAENDYFGQAVAINETGTAIAVGASVNANGGPSSGQVRAFLQVCTPPAAPTGNTTLSLCNGAIVAQLTATGTNVIWYDAASGGTLLNPITALTNNTIYYASQTVNACESTDRLAVTVQLLSLPAQPVSEVIQPTCSVATGTITITTQNAGETYSFNNGVNFQASNSMAGITAGTYQVLIKGTNGCISPVASVTVNAQPLPPATPVVQITHPSCTTSSGTITVTVQQAGESYSFNNGTDYQSSNIKSGLIAGEYQVMIKSTAGCPSVATLTTVNTAPVIPAAPTGTSTQTFCSNATVAQLTATGTSIKWYAAETGGTPLAETTTLQTGTYYASQTTTCESTARLAVAVTVTILTAPTGLTEQGFCEGANTIADLTAIAPNNETISWYTFASGGAPLTSTQVLTAGTYYAGYTLNGCESPRLAVQVGYVQLWKTVSAGFLHVLAIKPDGTLWAWGANAYGQLGDGTQNSRLSPVQIGTDKWVSISNYAYSSLGIKQDGTLWAWGSNGTGQLGDGTTTDRSSPVQIGTDKWTSIASSISHSLGIKQDGTLWGWGDNFSGQLGDGTSFNEGTYTTKLSPVQIGTDKWSSVSAILDASYGIKQDGTLWTWGGAFFRESNKPAALVPTKIGNDKWIKIATRGYNTSIFFPIVYQHALGIKQDGTLWAWGHNLDGQLGNGTTEYVDELNPVQIGTDNKWKEVSVSESISQAIKEDGTLWVWGDNFYGQLGDNTNTSRYSPVQIGTEEWLTISSNTLPSGYDREAKTYTVALKKNGTLWAWGNNESGQFGNGTISEEYTFDYQRTPLRLGATPLVLAKPALTVDFTNDSQPLLTTSGGSGYIWYKNDIIIDGANYATYSVPAVDGEGTYTVAVEVRGCQSPLSNEVPIYITALDFEPEASIQLYPNPAQESLLVKVAEQAQFSVVSMNGHVQRISTEWLSNEQAHRVHIKDLISGMYILQIQQNGKRAQVKFIKQ